MSIETPLKQPNISAKSDLLSRLPQSHEHTIDTVDFYDLEEIQRRHGEIAEDAALLAEGLGNEQPLAEAVAGAIAKRSQDIVDVAEKVASGEEKNLTIGEVSRAQRDLYFLIQATVLAFGVRDTYEGLVVSDTMVMPLKRESLGHAGYRFVYKTNTNTYGYEGDYDDAPMEEQDAYWKEGTPYRGTLTIDINPDTRVSLSYQPDIEQAREHHTTHDVVQRGDKTVAHEFDSLNVRIDVDPKALAGLAVDVGRSAFKSPTYIRESDLMGRVMETADTKNGSHTYDGFTKEMKPQFKPMAERLVARLTLGFNEHEAQQRAHAAEEELERRRGEKRPPSGRDAYLAEVVAAQALHRRTQRAHELEEGGDRSRYTRGY